MRRRAFFERQLWDLKTKGAYQQAQESFKDCVKEGVPLSRKILNTMMFVSNEQKEYKKTLELWELARKLTKRPNLPVFSQYIAALVGLREFDLAEGCLDLFREHQVINIDLCNHILNLFVTNKENARTAKVLQFIVESDLKLNLISYSILFEMNLNLKSLEGVEFLLEQMGDEGITPDLSLCNRLMFIFRELGKPERGFDIWKRMKAAEISPDLNSYHQLMHIFADSGRSDLLDETFRYLYRQNMVTHVTISEVVKAHGKLGNYAQAMRLFKLIKNHCDDETGTFMISLFKKAGKFDEAEELEKMLLTRYRNLLERSKADVLKVLNDHLSKTATE